MPEQLAELRLRYARLGLPTLQQAYTVGCCVCAITTASQPCYSGVAGFSAWIQKAPSSIRTGSARMEMFLDSVFEDHGLALPACPTVQTASGGFHRYLLG